MMKSMLGQMLRSAALPMVGVAAAGMMVVGCSKDSSSDPAAVTVDELKFPSNLAIQDGGNGAVTLSWLASNNETKFDGFNVYGMKTTVAGAAATGGGTTYSDLGVTTGKSIELLNADNTPDASGLATLANFDYDPNGKKLEAKGASPTPAADATSGNTPEISARPIFTYDTDGTTGLFPTCKANNTTTCTMTTAANKGQQDVGNGTIAFDVLGQSKNALVVGSTYCFLVLSSEKEGANVSQTSSNVQCVTPKFQTLTSIKLTLPTDRNNDATGTLIWDLTGWMKADCATTGTVGCSDPTAGTTKFLQVDTLNSGTAKIASSPGDVYVEETTSGTPSVTSWTWVTGATSGILDLGYYANGFTDTTFPSSIAPFVIDSANKLSGTAPDGNASSAGAPIFNSNGYSNAGQSVPLQANHIYVFAVKGTTGTAHYYYVSVSALASGVATIDVRTALADDITN